MDNKTSALFGGFENICYLYIFKTVNYACKVYQARDSRFEWDRKDTGLLQDGADAHDVSAVRKPLPS